MSNLVREIEIEIVELNSSSIDADAAAASATAAATSATSASTQATNAATSATAAATSATAAATSATNAATSATSAASSATAATTNGAAQVALAAAQVALATTQANNAAASYDSFDDRYLGPKSSGPSTDNDGGALITGALYFDTTVPEMRVYNGSAWVNMPFTAVGALLVANNLSDLASAATARTNLGVAIGSNVQAYSAELAAIAGLTSAANKGIMFTGSGTAATFDLTAAALTVLDDASTTAMLATLAAAGTGISNTFTLAQLFAAGTAALPSIAFSGDPNTGIYQISADTLGISTGGTLKMTIASTGVMDLPLADMTVYGVSVGRGAGGAATNTRVGYTALATANSGSNTAIGYQAMGLNTGASNVAVGYNALRNGTSTGNTAVGAIVMGNLTSGSNNVAVGYAALSGVTSGSTNIGIGQHAAALLTTGWSNTAVGHQSLYGITTTNSNTALGYYAGQGVTGDQNTDIGSSAGTSSTSGANNTTIGYNAQKSTATSSNQFTLGNSSVDTLRCQQTSITALSDSRDKTNVIDIPVGLALIKALRPVKFEWNMRDGAKVGILEGGFIAQELQAATTAANAEWLGVVDARNPERLEAAPAKFLPVMVKAIQELEARIAALEAI